MDSIVGTLEKTVFSRPMKIGDAVDTLHDFYTFVILIVIAGVVGYKIHSSDDISCWSPPELSISDEHINFHCWGSMMRNPAHGDSPDEPPVPVFGNTFYKWAVIFILAQAISFRLPYLLWTVLNNTTGGHMTRLRNLAEQAGDTEDAELKDKKMNKLFHYFDGWVAGASRAKHWRKHSPKGLCCSCLDNCLQHFLAREAGTLVSSMYLFIKFLNLLNVALNFTLVTLTLDTSFARYGLDTVFSIFRTGDWHDDLSFPRTLICDYNATNPDGTFTVYKVQCHMLTYTVLDKAFVLEWFLFVLLFVITLWNIIHWILQTKPPFSVHFFKKSFPVEDPALFPEVGWGPQVDENVTISDFIKNYLRSDGVLTIRLLELYVHKDIMHLFVKHTWTEFQKGPVCREMSAANTLKKKRSEEARIEKEAKQEGPSMLKKIGQKMRRSGGQDKGQLLSSGVDSYRSIEMEQP